MVNKSLSIIIPCRNEEMYIAECINSFLKMDYPKELMEIIVVDANSSDNTRNIVRDIQTGNKNILLIDNPDLYTPYALNLGIKNAKNEYVMIAGAHSDFSKFYLRELMNAIDHFKADGVGGTITTDVRNKNKRTLSICKVLSNKFGVGNSMFRIGSDQPMRVDIVPFGIYKKDLLLEIGLYNERLIRNHDMELSKRLTSKEKKIYLIPTAKCRYYAREKFFGIFKNNFGNGYWVPLTIYITKHLNSLSLRHFTPLIFMLSLILPVLLMFWYPILGVISLVSLFSYFLTIIVESARLKDSSTSFGYIFLAFLTLHFSYGMGSLLGLFKVNYLFNNNN
jgi:glycosyltransferase involved in cell wall biosynthesis